MRGVIALIAVAASMAVPASASAAQLRAGAGRADITPPTGYYAMGWVRADARLTGVHTRLYARAMVLERDGRKVALVAEDLGAIPGGMVADAAKLVAGRGFSERNVLVSASHTHAGPTGFYNFGAYNTVFMSSQAPTEFNTEADPRLYTFMVRRLAEAIRRADDDLAPARAAWASGRILGLTRNRSLEAHLANHGVMKEFGEGNLSDDPGGYEHTIDPEVHVLRVDKAGRGRRGVPIGMWSTFANHGTVNPYTFHFYNRDHHGSATAVAEQRMRREGGVRRGQEVVAAYGNSDEGDMSSALENRGPAHADFVGRIEAAEFHRLWRAAGRRLTSEPAIDLRWTRVCFCGQDTPEGPVDDEAVIGFPLFTGSEEGRGPLYDETGVPHEGKTNPIAFGPQGHKIQTAPSSDVPKAVPLLAVRVGDGLVVSVPGEMTAEMGRRVRSAVAGVAGDGVRRVTISGLANEYLQYFTTPEEYDRQHYEGGSVLFGRTASLVLQAGLVDLTRALAGGAAAPDPYPFDPGNGLAATAEPFGQGAERGEALEQPAAVQRLQRASFGWRGGPRGEDRPLDRAFVTIQRRVGRRWRAVDSDLGLAVVWEVDGEGRHTARWEVPVAAPLGKHRFVVTANRYRVESRSFTVSRSTALSLTDAPTRRGVAVRITYPAAVPEEDLTYRPLHARGGRVAFIVDGRKVVVRSRRAMKFAVANRGAQVQVPRSAATDRWGNRNGRALILGGP